MDVIKNKKGSTIVEVLVAAGLILIMTALFSQSVRVSMNFLKRAEEQRQEASDAEGYFYVNRKSASGGVKSTILLTGSMNVQLPVETYKMTASSGVEFSYFVPSEP